MVTRRSLLLAALTLAGGVARQSRAENGFPARPLTLIVPFPPGGVTDVLARLVAERIAARLKQSVVVDNTSGASGNIAMMRAAHADPDGHTLFLGTMGTNTINPALYGERLKLRPADAFAPLGMIATLPNALVVNPKKRDVTSVRELLALADNAAQPLTYGTFGNGSSSHLCSVLFGRSTNRTFLHVPFRGSPPAMMALLQGEIDFMFDSMPTALPQVRDGKVRPLAVSSVSRSAVLPDVPTMQEAGVSGFDLSVWFGLFTRNEVRSVIIDRLASELSAVVSDPTLQSRLQGLGADPFLLSRAETSALIARDTERWARVVRELNVRID